MSILKVQAIHEPDNDNEALTIDQSGNVTFSANVDMSAGTVTGIDTSNGDTAFSWGDHAQAGYLTTETYTGTLSNVVEDTSPQLGGNLDLNSSNITGTGNISITGNVTAGDVTVDNILPSTQLSHRNLIINGGFDVWQRGTSFSSLSSKTYTADRWYTFDGSVSKGTQVMPEGYTINSLDWTYNSVSGMHFWQGVEDGHPRLKDRACTLSVVLSCTSGTMSISPAFNGTTITGTVWNVTTTPTRFTYSRSASENSGLTGTNLYVGFDNLAGNNGTLKVSEFQLEVGSVATPFEHRSYGEELARCQRYYYKPGGDIETWRNWANSHGIGYIWFPVQMRIAPSVSNTANSYNVTSKTTHVFGYASTLTSGQAFGITADAEL